MRFNILLIGILLILNGCGGRKMSVGTARESITAPPQKILEKDDIDIVHITQTSGSSVVVETRVKTAFQLQKVNNAWEVQDIRIGDGQWEKIEDLAAALTRVKTEQTRLLLDQIADSVKKYSKDTGKMPLFEWLF